MRDQAKPLRTMLYVPANKEDWVRTVSYTHLTLPTKA